MATKSKKQTLKVNTDPGAVQTGKTHATVTGKSEKAPDLAKVIGALLKKAEVVTVSELDKEGKPKFFHRTPAKDFRLDRSKPYRLRFYGSGNKYLRQLNTR